MTSRYHHQDRTWTDVKGYIDNRSLPYNYVEDANSYYVSTQTGNFVLFCIVAKDGGADQTDFEANYLAGANVYAGTLIGIEGTDPTDVQRAIPVAQMGREGSSSVKVSHNFCDKTTWYTNAGTATDEVLTDLGAGLVFDSVYPNWIDLQHGKMYGENVINAGGEYTVIIKIDDVVQGFDDGYTVNHSTGQVTFDTPQIGKTIKASYRYATSSVFEVAPESGKILLIEHTEVQFTDDATISYGYPISFQSYVSGVGVVASTDYKSEFDIIDESNLGYHVPTFGVLSQDVRVFPFNYGTVKMLRDSQNVSVRCKIGGAIDTDGIDKALTGTKATVTFYCLSRDEV